MGDLTKSVNNRGSVKGGAVGFNDGCAVFAVVVAMYKGDKLSATKIKIHFFISLRPVKDERIAYQYFS